MRANFRIHIETCDWRPHCGCFFDLKASVLTLKGTGHLRTFHPTTLPQGHLIISKKHLVLN